MARLRGPDGCPWDREQTFDSIKRHTLEETYEVFDAIERLYGDGDYDVRLATTVGLLEGIQNVSGGKTDSETFVRYLRPRTAEKWQLLNDSWNGDIDAARRLDA